MWFNGIKKVHKNVHYICLKFNDFETKSFIVRFKKKNNMYDFSYVLIAAMSTNNVTSVTTTKKKISSNSAGEGWFSQE